MLSNKFLQIEPNQLKVILQNKDGRLLMQTTSAYQPISISVDVTFTDTEACRGVQLTMISHHIAATNRFRLKWGCSKYDIPSQCHRSFIHGSRGREISLLFTKVDKAEHKPDAPTKKRLWTTRLDTWILVEIPSPASLKTSRSRLVLGWPLLLNNSSMKHQHIIEQLVLVRFHSTKRRTLNPSCDSSMSLGLISVAQSAFSRCRYLPRWLSRESSISSNDDVTWRDAKKKHRSTAWSTNVRLRDCHGRRRENSLFISKGYKNGERTKTAYRFSSIPIEMQRQVFAIFFVLMLLAVVCSAENATESKFSKYHRCCWSHCCFVAKVIHFDEMHSDGTTMENVPFDENAAEELQCPPDCFKVMNGCQCEGRNPWKMNELSLP